MVLQAGIEQLNELLPLFHKYMDFYEQEIQKDKFKAFLKERLENEEAIVFMHYNEKNQANGFVVNYTSFSSFSLGKIMVLNDLFIDKSARNQGIGTQLIKKTFEIAKDKKIARVDISTANTNIGAQKLYERMGFVKDQDFCYYNYTV